MVNRFEFWTAATIILGGVAGLLTMLLSFQTDTATRLNIIGQNQLEQTEKLGEIKGVVGAVQALDRGRVEAVLTAMGMDPAARSLQTAQVYLARGGVSDMQLLDLSHAETTELTTIVQTYQVDGRELRCVPLQERERSAFLCAPRAQIIAASDQAAENGN